MVKSSFRGLNMAVEGGHEDAATSGTVKRAVLSPAGNNRWVIYFGQSQVWSKANASGGPGRLKLGNWTNRPMSANGHTCARTHTCAHTSITRPLILPTQYICIYIPSLAHSTT